MVAKDAGEVLGTNRSGPILNEATDSSLVTRISIQTHGAPFSER